MANPRKRGDQHVLNVYDTLMKTINRELIPPYERTVTATVEYLLELYPNIVSATCKFQAENTNAAKDLTLQLDDGSTIDVNLFLIKENAKIQTKNLGAKSFFSKYFLSNTLQNKFNEVFNLHYQEFLQGLIKHKSGKVLDLDVRTMKKIIAEDYPKFTPEIEEYRNKLLYNLREEAFLLLKDSYNEKSRGFEHAYHSLFMTEDTTIITRYGKNVTVERFSPSTPYFNMIDVYKSGRNSVGIKYGEMGLTLRFKFESGPNSSIKLATSYDKFPTEAENETVNKRTIRKMERLIENHKNTEEKNQSNAIGKCHEALTYYYFLIYFPNVLQVQHDECVTQLQEYYHIVKPDVLQRLYESTSTIIPAIKEKLYEKYIDYEIESIELVPGSYIKNRLDTGDLKLTLKVNGNYEIESISLKAVARKTKTGTSLTTKNPGIGTILGPTFFDIGDLNPIVAIVKERFEKKELNHKECQEVVAEELGRQLQHATQENLKRGIKNLLGEAMVAITFYRNNESVCIEHSEINTGIRVIPQKPSAIQTTLEWNKGDEIIRLRVKFSAGHHHGWSSLKLASEYLVKVN